MWGCGARRGPGCLWLALVLALAWGGPRVLAAEGEAGGEAPCGAEGWAQAAGPPGPVVAAAASYRGPGNNDTRGNKALPIVLWWSGSLFPHFPGDTERIDCPRGSCLATRSRRVARHRRTKALIFYGTDFRAYEAPLPRLPHQTWALFHEESPMNNYLLSHPPGIRLFNYTATFRRESDYPLTLQWLPSIAYLRGPPLALAEKDAWRRRGYGPVLYMQSHCDVPSDRDRYVRELMKYIQVDSYGKCLHNRELPSERLKDTSTATTEDSEFMAFIARENARIKEEQEHKKSRGKVPAPRPRVAHFQHMGCPMPTPGFGSVEDLSGGDSWKEMWLQDYWQSLDQGEALTAMIHRNESHQGRFWDYMHEIFLKRTRQH